MNAAGKFFIVASAVMLCGANCLGQVIRLEKQVVVREHQDVRLGDVATVTGIDAKTAEALKNTVILEDVGAPRMLKSEAVLLALMSQRGADGVGVDLQVAGATQCEISVGKKSMASGEAMTGNDGIRSTASTANAAVSVSDTDVTIVPMASPITPVVTASILSTTAKADAENNAGLTLEKMISNRIVQELGLPTTDVHIQFETISPLLEAPVAAGRKWMSRPLTRTMLGTVQFEAMLVEGTKVVSRLLVQTKVERKQLVVVTTMRLDRGSVVSAANLQTQETFVDRNVPTLFSDLRDIVGLEAQRAIDVGSTLDQRDFKSAMMANRGDLITVWYIAGRLEVRSRGMAMTDGKMHDQVQVKNQETGQWYQATLIGRRLAVMGDAISEQQESELRDKK
jgi:flagella basal body P-ring formation protein FlgA